MLGLFGNSYDLNEVSADQSITHMINPLTLKRAAADQQTRIVECVAEPGYGGHLIV